MDPVEDAKNTAEFLEAAKPFADRNQFVVGTFARGITFYRQQVRALNLIYSLHKVGESKCDPPIKNGARLAIIGAGAFGVTAAAAAAMIGFDVALFEKQQTILPLQRGCDTRWLHPRNYDWPAPEAFSSYAQLPVLGWNAGTAAQVAEEIEKRFDKILSNHPSTLRCNFDVKAIDISLNEDGTFKVIYNAADNQHIEQFDGVIYAIGFGTETLGTPSYWRNDELGQVDLNYKDGKKRKYTVSGAGDGGLVDLCRLTISDFRQDRIFDQIFNDQDDSIIDGLAALGKNPETTPGWIYEKLNELERSAPNDAIKDAQNHLRERLRADTEVILNDRAEDFSACLTLQKVSLSNALLTYCLYRISAFRYQKGEMSPPSYELSSAGERNEGLLARVRRAFEDPARLREGEAEQKNDEFVYRHGTDRETALNEIGLFDAITVIKEKSSKFNSGDPIYPPGWLRPSISDAEAKVEYVPPALRSHATAFVETLGNILGHLIKTIETDGTGEREFRLTLHRLTKIGGEEVFQQLSPYSGNVDEKGVVGRFISAEAGLIGLACKSGELVSIKKKKGNEANFNEVWKKTLLESSGALPVKPYVDSILACPFFAPCGGDGKDRVSLVLFADSAETEFFSDDVIGIISAACAGFVQTLEDLLSQGAIKYLPTRYHGYQIHADYGDEKSEYQDLGVNFGASEFIDYKELLRFQNLKTMDIEVSVAGL